MSHQHHFLSRLDRVSLPHVELALSLYRDPDMLRFIIGSVRLPEGGERVALSLDHPERGPFLIVTRDGRFVTCLGEGMQVDLPVITRGQLDGLAAKVTDLRARMEACRTLAGQRGGMGKLLARVYEAADELSREEFVAISALQPLYRGVEFLNLLFGAASDLEAARDRLLQAMRRSDKLKPAYREVLRAYWNLCFAIGHFSVLTGMSGPKLLEELPDDLAEQLLEGSFSWGAVRQGIVALALKGIWGAARIGKPYLPTYKRLFFKSGSLLTMTDASMGLAALGLRHSRLRAEVQKTLASGPPIDREDALGKYLRKLLEVIQRSLELEMEHPEASALVQREFGAVLCIKIAEGLPRGSPFRFERVEDVPEDLAMTLAVNNECDFLDAGVTLPVMLACLPWVARAAPEQLYLPRDFIKATRAPWTPEHTCRLLRAHRDHYGSRAPQKPEGPTRNGPCPCGSGKKYKRCCAEGAVG